MKLPLKNIRENYNKEEKQEEDNSANFNKLFSYSNRMIKFINLNTIKNNKRA